MSEKIEIPYPHHFYVKLLDLTDRRQVKQDLCTVRSLRRRAELSIVKVHPRTGSPPLSDETVFFSQKFDFILRDLLPDEPVFLMNEYQINRVLV